MKSLVRIFFGLLLVGGIAAAFAYAFWPRPLEVELAAVVRGPLRVTVDEDGKTRIKTKKRYVVSTPLAGRMQRVELDPGDKVTQGETLLATIEPNEPDILDARALAQAEAKVKAAEAVLARVAPVLERTHVELEHAGNELQRQQGLAERKATPQDQLEKAQMLYRTLEQDYKAAKFAEDVARFELEMARAALLRTRPTQNGPPDGRQFPIRSPITGTVLRVFQKSETVVAAGARLLELGDAEDLEAEIDVLSSDAVKIQPGMTAYLEQWGGNAPLMGHVRLVEPSAFTKVSALGVEEQRVNVIIDFVDPPQNRAALGDAFRVEARIVIWEQPDVLQVPTGALFRSGDAWAVFVADQDQAHLRTVELGHRNSQAAQVLSGLQVGDQVVLHPSDKVRDGFAVKKRDLGM